MKNEEIRKVIEAEGSKSQKMIKLYNEGLEVGEIAKAMGVRYNFVYNVVSNDCRKAGTEIRVTRKQGSVKESIVELIEAGKTNTEISKELGKNYNYVFKVRKEYEATKA
jgi:transposase-like protein